MGHPSRRGTIEYRMEIRGHGFIRGDEIGIGAGPIIVLPFDALENGIVKGSKFEG